MRVKAPGSPWGTKAGFAEQACALPLTPFLDQVSDEDTLKGAACKKVVTFDLSDSEDTNSVASSDVPRHTRELQVWPGSRVSATCTLPCLLVQIQLSRLSLSMRVFWPCALFLLVLVAVLFPRAGVLQEGIVPYRGTVSETEREQECSLGNGGGASSAEHRAHVACTLVPRAIDASGPALPCLSTCVLPGRAWLGLFHLPSPQQERLLPWS